MKLSVLSNLFYRFSVEKTFRMAAENGFDGIELCGLRPHAYAWDMDENRCAHIRALAQQYGLEISMYTPELLMYPYNVSSAYRTEREQTAAYLKKSVDVAAALGTPRVQLTCGHPGYFTDRKVNMQNAVETLLPVCEEAERMGIDLIVECLTIMESSTVVMLDSFCELLEKIDSPRLCSMLDSAMVMTNWEPLDSYFEKLGDRLQYVHWGDSHGENERHLEIGMGRIDPESFLTLYTGMVTTAGSVWNCSVSISENRKCTACTRQNSSKRCFPGMIGRRQRYENSSSFYSFLPLSA